MKPTKEKLLGRIRTTHSLKVGDLTNKGIVEVIFNLTEVRINACYYNLTLDMVYRQLDTIAHKESSQ